jgi:hypothetical protein
MSGRVPALAALCALRFFWQKRLKMGFLGILPESGIMRAEGA